MGGRIEYYKLVLNYRKILKEYYGTEISKNNAKAQFIKQV
jgi:hypothetical protein